MLCCWWIAAHAARHSAVAAASGLGSSKTFVGASIHGHLAALYWLHGPILRREKAAAALIGGKLAFFSFSQRRLASPGSLSAGATATSSVTTSPYSTVQLLLKFGFL